MEKYNHKKIEAKWQKYWAEHPELCCADNESQAEKQYILDMWPYPSGDGLHVGHVESYTATDIMSRYLRLNGKNVLHPQGWDAFGLPAENFAIKTKIHPAETTKKAVATFKKQMNLMGFSYDWSREAASNDPEYYKWTQWFFLLFYKNGLAYKKKAKVNWCDECQTVLANEQAEGGICERCKNEVIQKDMEQWFFKITDFIENKGETAGLLNGLDKVDWPESTKAAQKNWIGKSEGAIIKLPTQFKNNSEVKYAKILLATNNLSKRARVEKLLKSLGITTEILLPKDLGIKVVEPQEKGSLRENAKEKVLLYRDKTDLPILGFDTGLFIDGEAIDPVKVKRNALRGADEKKLTQEETAKLLLKYYKNIAEKRGGSVEAYFQDELAISLSNGEIETIGNKREIILTDQVKGEIDIYFPIRSLYKIKATGEYAQEQNEKEELIDLAPFIESLKKLLSKDNLYLEVFTTRLDTVFGMTYAVVSPEHKIINKLRPQIKNWPEVEKYLKQAKKKTDLQRMENKEKTGVRLEGIEVVNPFNGEAIPLFTADYVLAQYGTGAVMAVPAHDERDFEFAQSHRLQFQEVINTTTYKLGPLALGKGWPYTEDGVLVNSGEYNGLNSSEAREKMTAWLKKEKLGRRQINYKLRDWLVSRQRYWGAPIPIIYCKTCGEVPVPEKDLPVELPTDVDFMPTGESPLVKSKSFHDVKCPQCGGAARRESDTMDTFVCSSWYYFRYADVDNKKAFASEAMLKKWLPVDLYVGGAEHTVLHLLYARFFTKVLHNLGYIKFDEPFLKLRHQGIILAEDGRKMSKSFGNVINPDDVVKVHGADALRLFEMFMGPLEDMKPWNTRGIVGISRFLEKISKMVLEKKLADCGGGEKPCENVPEGMPQLLHKTIKKVTEDIEALRFNTAISQMMIFVNFAAKFDSMPRAAAEKFLILLAPFAPHLAEELWAELGNKESIFKSDWPKFNPELAKDETINLIIQVNGKVRDMIEVSADISENEAKKIALESEKVKKWLEGKEVIKTIFVKGKLVNIVIK